MNDDDENAAAAAAADLIITVKCLTCGNSSEIGGEEMLLCCDREMVRESLHCNEEKTKDRFEIQSRESYELCGVEGTRYWVYNPFIFTGDQEIDSSLSNFWVYIFGANTCSKKVAYIFQGLCAPATWSGETMAHLTHEGFAVVLIEMPFSGHRSVAKTLNTGNPAMELYPLVEKNIKFGADSLVSMMQAIRVDVLLVRDHIVKEIHRLPDDEDSTIVVGFSIGCVFGGSCFALDRIGSRLLAIAGHIDLPKLAKGYAGKVFPTLAHSAVGTLVQKVLKRRHHWSAGWIPLLRLLKQVIKANERLKWLLSPMQHVDEIGQRKVSFLVGDHDAFVNIKDVANCASVLANGHWVKGAGLGHGCHEKGMQHWHDQVNAFLSQQLADWKPS